MLANHSEIAGAGKPRSKLRKVTVPSETVHHSSSVIVVVAVSSFHISRGAGNAYETDMEEELKAHMSASETDMGEDLKAENVYEEMKVEKVYEEMKVERGHGQDEKVTHV